MKGFLKRFLACFVAAAIMLTTESVVAYADAVSVITANSMCTFSIAAKKSVKITNSGSESVDVESDSAENLFVSYNADGSVYDQSLAASTTTVVAGGYAVVTSNGNVTQSYEYPAASSANIAVETSDTAALTLCAVVPGKNYKFTNTSDATVKVLSYSNVVTFMDGALYNADGTLDGLCLSYSYMPELEAGQYLCLTATDNVTTNLYVASALIDSGAVTFAETDEPAIHTLKIEYGKDYEITNNSDGTLSFSNNSGYNNFIDAVFYDAEGVVKAKYLAYNHLPDLESGCKAVITGINSNTYSIMFPQNLVTTEKVIVKDETEQELDPAYYSFTIENGKSYKIVNNSTFDISFDDNTGYNDFIDWVCYLNDTNAYSSKGIAFEYVPALAGGEYMIVTGIYDSTTTVKVPYAYFKNGDITVEDYADPTYYSFTIEKDKSYKITNSGTDDISFDDNTGYNDFIDWVCYLNDTDAYSSKGIAFDYVPTLSSGKYLIVTGIYDSTTTVKVPYAYFKNGDITVEDYADPTYYSFTIEKDKSYKITNSGTDDISFDDNTGYNDFIDWVSYFTATDAYSSKGIAFEYVPTLSSEKYLIVTGIYDSTTTVKVPYTYFKNGDLTVEDYADPTYYSFTIEKDKSYKITNSGTDDISFDDNTGYNDFIDWVCYFNATDAYSSKGIAFEYVPTLSSEKYLIVTGILDSTTTVKVPYTYFKNGDITVKDYADPTYYSFTIEKDKSYKITNSGTDDISFDDNTGYNDFIDWVCYLNDTDAYSSKGIAFEYVPTLSSEKYLIVTGIYDSTTTVKVPYTYFKNGDITIADYEDPAYYSFTVEKDKNYKITNSSADTLSFEDNTGYNDFVRWASYYTATDKYDTCDTENYYIPNISPEKYIIATGIYDTVTTVKVPYSYYKNGGITVEDSADPAFYSFTVEKDKNYKIVNTGETRYDVYDDTVYNNYVAYAHYYNATDKLIDSDSASYYIPYLDAETYFIITGIYDQTTTVMIPYKGFKDGEVTVSDYQFPVFQKVSLESGKTYKITNGTADSASFFDDTNEVLCDYVIFNGNGEVYTYGTKSKDVNNLSAGQYELVQMNYGLDANLSVLYSVYTDEHFTIEEYAEPAMYYYTLGAGETVKVVNNADGSFDIYNTNTESLGYILDSIGYRISDDFIDDCWPDSYYIRTLYEGTYEIVTSKVDVAIDYAVPYTYYKNGKISFIPSDIPSYETITLAPGKTAIFTCDADGSDSIAYVTANAQKYDYLSNGTGEDVITADCSDNTYYNISAGDKLAVHASSENTEDITIKVPGTAIGFISTMSSAGLADLSDTLDELKIDITRTLCGTASSKQTHDLTRNYSISLYNVTAGSEVYVSSKSDAGIYIDANAVNVGDTLRLTLSSVNVEKTSVEFALTSDFSTSVTLKDRSVITVTGVSSGSDTPRLLIFSADGKLYDSYSYSNGITTDPIPNGTYTVAAFKTESRYYTMQSLDELSGRGFVENTDYVKQQLDVVEGNIYEINVSGISNIAADKISYFDRSATTVTIENSDLYAGATAKVVVDFKVKDFYASQLENIIINADINEDNIWFTENSVMMDGVAVPYTYENGRLTITVTGKSSGKVRFTLKPINATENTINFTTDLTLNGSAKSETLGSIKLCVKGVTINAATEVSTREVLANGITTPSTVVSVYVDGSYSGMVTSAKNGSYKLTAALPEKDGSNEYTLYAKTNAAKSSGLTVKYSGMNAVEIVEYKVISNSHNSQGKVFDLVEEEQNNHKSIIYYQSGRDFEFSLKINNDQNLEKVYITSTKNGEVALMEAVKDAVSGYWIAKGFFNGDENYYPGDLGVTYKEKAPECNPTEQQAKDVAANYSSILEDKGLVIAPPASGDVSDDEHFSYDINGTDGEKKATVSMTKSTYEQGDIANTYHGAFSGIVVIASTNASYDARSGYSGNSRVKYYGYSISSGYVASTPKYTFGVKQSEGQTFIDLFDHSTFDHTALAFDAIDAATGGEIFSELSEGMGEIGNSLGQIDAVLNFLDKANEIFNSGITDGDTLASLTAEAALVEAAKYFASAAIGEIAKNVAVGLAFTNPVAAVAVVVGGFLLNQFVGWAIDKWFESELDKAKKFNGLKWLWDPSGYVYEVTESNRLKGVTATVYYQGLDGSAILWDAENYEQVNPQITDINGCYAWDVPEGMWQVKYELEGYNTTYSEWLPVPPPQMEVNVEMVSTLAPNAAAITLTASGATLTFDNYVDVASLTSALAVKVNDTATAVTAAAIDAVDYKGTSVAKQFAISGITLVSGDKLTAFYKGAKSYAGVEQAEDSSIEQTFLPLPDTLTADNKIAVDYTGATSQITFKLSGAGVDFTKVGVTAELANSGVFELDGAPVVAADGTVTVNLKTLLAGTASLNVKVNGTELSKAIELESVFAAASKVIKSISYVIGDGAECTGATTYTEGEGVVLGSAKRNGYKFMGWYTNPFFSGDPITEINSLTKGNVILYALWEKLGVVLDYAAELPSVTGLQAGETVTKLLSTVARDYLAVGESAELLNADDTEADDDAIVKTGMKLKISGTSGDNILTLIVSGDVNGDGEITIDDIKTMLTQSLSSAQQLASNTGDSDSATVIFSYILGLTDVIA